MDVGEDPLARGRAAFDAADWRTAYDLLTGVDETSPLGAEDLDRVAEVGMAPSRAQAASATATLGGRCRNRTDDLLVVSELLCQLS